MGGGGCREKVKEAVCSENIMYICMKTKNETCWGTGSDKGEW
jgi:hypothetical protein